MNRSTGSGETWHQDVGTWFKSLPNWVVDGPGLHGNGQSDHQWGQSNHTLTFGEAQKLIFGHTAVAVVINVALLTGINHLHQLLFLVHLALKGASRCLGFISQEATGTLSTVRQQFIWNRWIRRAWERCTARREEPSPPTGLNNDNYNRGLDGGIEPAIAAIGQAINDLPMPAVANPHPNPLPITSQARAHTRSLSQLCGLDEQLAAQVSPTVNTGTMTRSALQLPLSTTSFPAGFPPELLRTPSPASGTSSPPNPQNHQVQFHIG